MASIASTKLFVTEERENSTGRYFTLSVKTTGGLLHPVTVKLSKHGKYVCLTHLTADACVHSRCARRYVEANQNVQHADSREPLQT